MTAADPRPDVLITGGTVVTMDRERRVIEDGAVLVHEGRIAAVGTRAEVGLAPPGATTIEARDGLVLRASSTPTPTSSRPCSKGSATTARSTAG